MSADLRLDQLTAAVIGDLTDLSLMYMATTADAGVTFADKKVSLSLMQQRIFQTTFAQGTLTASTPALISTATWNNAAVTFTHQSANITDSASGAESLFFDYQIGGSTKLNARKDGALFTNGARAFMTVVGNTPAAGSINVFTPSVGFKAWRAGGGPTLDLQAAAGSFASPTAITPSQGILVRFGGYDGTSNGTTGATVGGRATETWAVGAHGMKLEFSTTPNGSTVSTLALTLDQNQTAIFAGAVRLANAYVAGAVTPTGTVTIQDSTGTTYRIPALV